MQMPDFKQLTARMANIKRTHKIAVAAGLLLVGGYIAYSLFFNKPAVSIVKASVKTIKDANSVNKKAVKDSNSITKKSVRDANSAGRRNRLADANRPADSNGVKGTSRKTGRAKKAGAGKAVADNNSVSDVNNPIPILTDANGNIFVDVNQWDGNKSLVSDSNKIAEGNDVQSQNLSGPDIIFHTIDGNEISLAGLRGKRVILDFWATWCGPCRNEIPHFVKMRNEMDANKLEIIGVSSEKPEVLRKFANENAINYPIASDTNLPAPYDKIKAFPTTYFLDSNGSVENVLVGYHDIDILREYAMGGDLAGLKALASAQTSTMPQAKTKSEDLASNVSDITSGVQSLIFVKGMPITDALQLLGVRYGKNIIPMSNIAGNLNFSRLTNVNFDEAMSAILGNEYRYQQQGNLVKVYSTKDYKTGEMICKVFTLYYISAVEAKKMVLPVLSSEGKVEVTTAAQTGVPLGDTLTAPTGAGDSTAINDMLVVYDYPDRIERAEQIITALDIRPKQVLVEATIMTATLTNGMQLGIDWQNLQNVVISSLSTSQSRPNGYIGVTGSSTTQVGAAIPGGLTVATTIGSIAAVIHAVESITDVTVLANPKIMAANKQLGEVYIGTKVAYQSQTTQSGGNDSTTAKIDYLDTGTTLSFRPYIGDDGYIRMDIHPKNSSAALRNITANPNSGLMAPDETSAEIVSNIVVKDGETIIIGGLFRDKITNAKTQVPVLGNIPIIGLAFSDRANEIVREEVIVLLTPHIIKEPNQADGAERAADVARKKMGAEDETPLTNNMKMAMEFYDQATALYIKGKKTEALKKLNAALYLYPNYLEAMTLKEKIEKEINPRKKQERQIINEAQKPESNKWRRN